MKIQRPVRVSQSLCVLVGLMAFDMSPVVAASLPAGFTESAVAIGLSSPTAMQIAPDGRIFVCEQGGRLRVIKDGSLLSTPFVSLSVNAEGERGLLGVAFDPSFAANRYVYVYYTTSTSPHNRISRFTANGDVAVAGSEVVIFDVDTVTGASVHNGGAIAFGPDRKLYAAVGEHSDGTRSQSLANVLGKVLRINTDGSIPTDNPFYGVAGGRNQAIWALGLRNPFTFAFNPQGTELFINDVGANSWEEIDDGWAGANYGWPVTEGATDDPRFVSPHHTYSHDDGSCAITGGTFYSPLVSQFPSDNFGDYFFADYCGGWIRRMDQPSGQIRDFATGISSPVDLKVSDDGSLYYLGRGAGATTGFVVRITRGANAPTITRHPANVTVQAGNQASFSVDASSPQTLRYQWQRNGDNISGANGSTYTIGSVSQSDQGARFRVAVSNDFGTTLSNEATLTVGGNQAPGAIITQPAVSSTYAGGSMIAYAGTGTDQEDGNLPSSAFTWQVDFHHDTHTHPFVQPTTGARSGTFTIPTTGETSANVWYRIYLTVRDSGGLTRTVERDIFPRKATLSLSTNPPGLQVRLDGQPVSTPFTFDGVVGIVRTVDAMTPQSSGGATYTWNGWSDGGAVNHDIVTPSANTTYVATYAATSGGGGGGGSGSGLSATYFGNTNLTDPVLQRIDPTVNFSWGAGSPGGGVGSEFFSVRWTGQIQAQFSETYTFFTQADGGVRLWVDGQVLIDNWSLHAETENSGQLSLTEGQRVNIVLEYFEQDGEATMRLLWRSPSTAEAVVPASRLYPAASVPEQVFLSDLPWTYAASGWGPVERDRSNGETEPGDGGPIAIAGNTFPKGLGVHAPSDLRYVLPSGCWQFQAEIGLDDEMGGDGRVTFEVWGDGTRLYASPELTGFGESVNVNLALSGQTSLQLVVIGAGEDKTSDHADWAMARVTCQGGQYQGTFLSDLPWAAASNGWGPVERDRSNGEAEPGDGGPIRIAGNTFPKGLGVHAPSDLRYALPSGCSQFQAEIGLDDESGGIGRVTFEVWADGARLYASPELTGSDGSVNVDVALSGQTDLQLVVTGASDDITSDHADWAMARVTCQGGQNQGTFLSDLPWTAASNGWGPVELDRSNGEAEPGDGGPIAIAGNIFPKGLGVHAPSDLRYALPSGCSQFQAEIGLDDESGGIGRVTFEVWADGARLYASPELTGSDGSVNVDVALSGQTNLQLVVTRVGEDMTSDHADWAMARVTCP